MPVGSGSSMVNFTPRLQVAPVMGRAVSPILHRQSTLPVGLARPSVAAGGATTGLGPSLLLDLRRPLAELAAQESSECSPRDSVWKRYFCNNNNSQRLDTSNVSSLAAPRSSLPAQPHAVAEGPGSPGPARRSRVTMDGAAPQVFGGSEAYVPLLEQPRLDESAMSAPSTLMPPPGSLQLSARTDTSQLHSLVEESLSRLPMETLLPGAQERVRNFGVHRHDSANDRSHLSMSGSAAEAQVEGNSRNASCIQDSVEMMKESPSTPPRMPNLTSPFLDSEQDRALAMKKVELVNMMETSTASTTSREVPPEHGMQLEQSALSNTAMSAPLSQQSVPQQVIMTASGVMSLAEEISAMDLQQIRSTSRPHICIREVAETTLMIMGYPDSTWTAAQVYWERADSFLEKMRVFDASRCVSRLQFHKLCRSLGSQHNSFAEGHVETICPSAVGLVRWCRAVGELVGARYGSAPEQMRRRSGGRSPRPADEQAGAYPRRDERNEDEDTFVGPPSRPNLGDLEVSPDVYSMSAAELRRVRDLTVRKPNVGEVTFPGELDLVRDRRVLEDLPSIVRLEPGEVVLYPDPSTKPREGEGLNRPATITLFQCKPPSGCFMDADSKARYRDRIAKMTEAKGACFVDYDCDRGIWRFRVDHF